MSEGAKYCRKKRTIFYRCEMRSTRKVNKTGKRVKVIIIKIRIRMGMGIGWRTEREWNGREWVCECECECEGARN
jgi:hypothetical protein